MSDEKQRIASLKKTKGRKAEDISDELIKKTHSIKVFRILVKKIPIDQKPIRSQPTFFVFQSDSTQLNARLSKHNGTIVLERDINGEITNKEKDRQEMEMALSFAAKQQTGAAATNTSVRRQGWLEEILGQQQIDKGQKK